MTEINEERMRGGIAAMRSRKYRKGGQGYLHLIQGPGVADLWCCLGVLSDYAIANGCQVTRRVVNVPGREWQCERFGSPENNEYLSVEVRDWYGIDSRDPLLVIPGGGKIRASVWNDSGLLPGGPDPDFGPIADGFERTYLPS